MTTSSFARFAIVFFNLVHFLAVLFQNATWNDLFCSFMEDVTWHVFFLVISKPLVAISFQHNWKAFCMHAIFYFWWFSRLTFRFPYANQLVERYEKADDRVYAVCFASATIAANKTKRSSICFWGESFNNRWVLNTTPMNIIYSQCFTNGLSH